MKKYILIGIPDSGKSTLGKRAAEILKLPFFDTDEMTVDLLNLEHPREIFRAAQTGRFLIAQRKAVEELARLDGPAMIATGAEVALIPECAEIMREIGTIIHIRRDPEIMIAGIRNSGKRGLIMYDATAGVNVDTREEAIKMFAVDMSKYEELAELTLENNGDEDEGVKNLIALINSQGENDA